MGWGGYLVVVGGVFEQEDFFFISRRKKFRIWFFGGCRFFFYCFSYRFFKLFIRDTEKKLSLYCRRMLF